ncbi:hypothetical protein Tco_0089794 [Tanacetum coccineum]
MTTSDQHHSQDDEVVTQIQPQITIVANTNAKFPYLKKVTRRLQKTQVEPSRSVLLCLLMNIWLFRSGNKSKDLSCFQLFPERPNGRFLPAGRCQEIWQAIKARFGGNEESKKMQKSFLKQEFEEFKITEAEVTFVLKTKEELKYLSFDDLYNKLKSLEFDVKGHAPKPSSLANAAFVSTVSTNNDTISNHSSSYTTSPSYSGNREASSSHGGVVDDVIHFFLAESKPKQ